MTSTPVWLLDVDGVINASKPGWSGTPRTDYATAGDMQFRIRWAPALVERIRRMHVSGRVEIRWCTTWCPWADRIERILGLPALGRAFTDEVNGYAARQAKYMAARYVLAEGRRLIWTDDEAIPRGLDREELEAYGALLIEPRGSRGLQPEDIQRIEAYLADDGRWCCGGNDCAGVCGETLQPGDIGVPSPADIDSVAFASGGGFRSHAVTFDPGEEATCA